MFLLVLTFTFIAAQMVMRKKEVFADEEDYLIKGDNCEANQEIDGLEEEESDSDIFVI